MYGRPYYLAFPFTYLTLVRSLLPQQGQSTGAGEVFKLGSRTALIGVPWDWPWG